MIPAVGFYYGGIIKRKNSLTLLMSTVIGLAVVSFQWFFWGFSLSFSETGNHFCGDLGKLI
jgi:ammonium transporter, Amt family